MPCKTISFYTSFSCHRMFSFSKVLIRNDCSIWKEGGESCQQIEMTLGDKEFKGIMSRNLKKLKLESFGQIDGSHPVYNFLQAFPLAQKFSYPELRDLELDMLSLQIFSEVNRTDIWVERVEQ